MGFAITTTLYALGVLCVSIAAAQRLAYTSFPVTDCFTQAVLHPGVGYPQPAAPYQGQSSYREIIPVSYTMPPCIYCDCPGCTILSKFSTAYPVFCTEGGVGTTHQQYAITETYLGLSSLPVFESPTSVPFGFTTRLETCEAGRCGPRATTAPMTYPAGGAPFVGTLVPMSMSTQYPGSMTLESPAVPAPTAAPAPPEATIVTGGGNALRMPSIMAGSMLLLAVIC